MGGEFMMSFVYAKCTKEERRDLWDDLINIHPSSDIPWMIGGDFNVVMRDNEKVGGRMVDMQAASEFTDTINACNLMEVNFTGSDITWCNNRHGRKRIQARLDRLMCNGKWYDKFNCTHYHHLNRTHSDHAPMLLTFGISNRKGGSPFKFLNYWTNHENFQEVIKEYWTQGYPGVGGEFMHAFASKLRGLKGVLKVWSKTNYGNIFKNTIDAEQKVEEAEKIFTCRNDENSMIQLNHAKANLIRHLAVEDEYWKQKANVRFNLEGDKNTKFFHATVKGRRARSLIHRIKDDNGSWLEKDEEINSHIVNFYKNQLNRDSEEELMSNCCKDIPHLIEGHDNERLDAIPDINEVKEAVWGLNKDSAAGPDGFNGHFYRCCWEIIKNDLHMTIKEYFSGEEYPKSWTSTNIVLIPKTQKPELQPTKTYLP